MRGLDCAQKDAFILQFLAVTKCYCLDVSTNSEKTSTKEKDNTEPEGDLFCICRTPYNQYRYVDGARVTEIVGERERERVTETVGDREKLDNPNINSFYIGCDSCQEWYHGTCVGISEIEAEKIEVYICDKCKQQQGKKLMMSISQYLLTICCGIKPTVV